eukprot:Clim_evm3s94 gene=Clim_evmTU3s94
MAEVSINEVVSQVLINSGVDVVFGVPGIPVTRLAECMQRLGADFISFRNEQSAGYAACEYGYMLQRGSKNRSQQQGQQTNGGKFGVMLTVSGPGFAHALGALHHAKSNRMPLLLISGACSIDEIGLGAFQEMDQMASARPLVKHCEQPTNAEEVIPAIQNCLRALVTGVPGPVYLDLPANVLRMSLPQEILTAAQVDAISEPEINNVVLREQRASEFVENGTVVTDPSMALPSSEPICPLIVLGEEFSAWDLKDGTVHEYLAGYFPVSVPVLPLPQLKGVMHGLDEEDKGIFDASAARSKVLKESNLVILLGARLNWQLHFGIPPRWNPKARFLHVSAYCSDDDAKDAGKTDQQLWLDQRKGSTLESPTFVAAITELASRVRMVGVGAARHTVKLLTRDAHVDEAWLAAVREKANTNISKAATKFSRAVQENKDQSAAANGSKPVHMNFTPALQAIANSITPEVGRLVIVNEGANTMDLGRVQLPAGVGPLGRIDAGVQGTMGLAMGQTFAASYFFSGPDSASGEHRLVVAVLGDSSFGFSGMDCETLGRYVRSNVIICIFNNQGVYGGQNPSQREGVPAVTDLGDSRYDLLASALGLEGYDVGTYDDLYHRMTILVERWREHVERGTPNRPAIINVHINPLDGAESGSMQAHN